MTIAGIYRRLGFLTPSPFLKQAPTAILFAFIVAMANVVPDAVPGAGAVVASALAVAIATIFAAVITNNPKLARFTLAIPALDFIAIAALHVGTPVGTSAYSILVILPLVWVAAEEGYKFVILAILGTSLLVLIPLIAGQPIATNASDLVRLIFAIAVFVVAAIIINELSRQSRQRLEKVKRLADQSKVMLAESIEHAADMAKSEAKVRATERMFRGLWGAVTEQSVIGTDVTGLIDAWNPGASKLLGLSMEDVQGVRHVDEFHLAEELLERARELEYPAGATVLNPGFSALVESARLGRPDVREWSYLHPDGTQIPVELSVTARLGENGETVGYLFVAYDMTKAREVARLKDEFVGLISHELRTPLSSILGYLELLRDDEDVPLSENQLRYLGVAERNAHRLLRLVGDLLFTAQVESGKFHLDEREQSLTPILAASVESARPVATAAGIILKLEAGEDFIVNADAVRLGQACDNLISNAIKFTPNGGMVTVGLRVADGNAIITVEDTGMGIAADELDKLFSRFFRATTATRNAVPGVGLGLVITRAIVRAHGGDMGVTSEEGVGTCFSMTLPMLEPARV